MLLELAHALFVDPIPVTGIGRLGMLLPLSLSISLVYKTIRCRRLPQVPWASLVMSFTIVALMMLIGAILLLLFRLLA